MFMKQADIFWGMDHGFVTRLFDHSEKEAHLKGDILFHEGDPADAFYILVKGWVNISMTEENQVVYVINHPGEAFGWSSLVGRDHYSASAQCVQPTKLLRLNKRDIMAACDKDPVHGMVFYKHLARSIGNRLIKSYHRASAEMPNMFAQTYGSGQILQSLDDSV